eukprot:GILJ01001841.1.p1 GENE.GILJ01001841.1~~GILJ01001841.1.p1  ORF type:complete len:436 (+),score=64.57 GILJ01001841.1:55-1362(+)
MERPCHFLEHFWHARSQKGWHTRVFFCEVRGPVIAQADLTQALKKMAVLQPTLRSRIQVEEKDGRRTRHWRPLDAESDFFELLMEQYVSDDAAIETLKPHCKRPFASDEPTIRVVYFAGTPVDGCETISKLALLECHTQLDGTSMAHFVHELFSVLSSPDGSLPHEPYEIFNKIPVDFFEQFVPEEERAEVAKHESFPVGAYVPFDNQWPEDNMLSSTYTTFRVGPELLQQFVKKCKANGATITCALSAILLQASNTLAIEHGGEPNAVQTIGVPYNFRAKLGVPRLYLGNCASVTPVSIAPGTNEEEMWATSKFVQSSITDPNAVKHMLGRDFKRASMIPFVNFDEFPQPKAVTFSVLLSNMGLVQLDENYGEWKLGEYQWLPFTVNCMFMSFQLAAYTAHGVMHLTLQWPQELYRRETGERFMQEIIKRIEAN